ncbi:Hsc70-interacting protein 1 [Operophtera brumata]|uniref:Hsc70-interacting protein 1 n=1 Tax=Operophtera brumata TaxID=104452 RepID=A0A0L7KJF5_OPEBR|nr:Hsc70-interacting protein 1 [Operophtera brumata]
MSGCPFSAEQLVQLKAFISACQAEPALLHHPKLEFFKDFLLSMGAVLPPVHSFNAKPSGDTTPG